MPPRIVVVGAGFAGIWSALAAVRRARQQGTGDSLEVTIVAPGPDLVLRPRLYQSDPDRQRVPLDRLLPTGVRHVRGAVLGIDHRGKTVEVATPDGEVSLLHWDRLVLASGSQIRRPQVAGPGRVHDVDSLEAARALEEHLAGLPATGVPGRGTAVVVGSGLTGLEVATELRSRLRLAGAAEGGAEPRVVLVERHHEVGPTLGPGPRGAIVAQLSAAGIEVHLGDSLQHYDGRTATLASGTRIGAGTVVWTVGMAASPLTAQLPGARDGLGRLQVDEFLRLPEAPDVFVAGDTAAAVLEDGHTPPQSCQYAIPSGKTAGWNAAASLIDPPGALLRFRPAGYVTCVDLGEGGAVFTTGWEREVQLVGPEAKRLKASINEMIDPSPGDLELLLEQADPARAPEGLTVA